LADCPARDFLCRTPRRCLKLIGAVAENGLSAARGIPRRLHHFFLKIVRSATARRAIERRRLNEVWTSRREKLINTGAAVGWGAARKFDLANDGKREKTSQKDYAQRQSRSFKRGEMSREIIFIEAQVWV